MRFESPTQLKQCLANYGVAGGYQLWYMQNDSHKLLVYCGRDANNQMFPIAWAVVGVENKNNWCWFLSLLHDDLNLGSGSGITIISDAHKVS